MILDTNTLSALADSNDSLIERIHFVPIIYVTLISIGEYHYGISQSRKREELSEWLTAFLLKAQVLAPTLQTIPYYSAIRRELKSVGTPIPANDCWIAAIAREYNLPIVSRDHHFDKVKEIRRIDW